MKIKKQKQKRNKKVKNDYNEGKIIIKTRFSSRCYMFSFRGGLWGGEGSPHGPPLGSVPEL